MSQNTVVPVFFCVLFNGSSTSSVQLNALVENCLTLGHAADLISIHTVCCELLAVLVAESLWSKTWLLATKNLSFEYHMVSGVSYGYIYAL